MIANCIEYFLIQGFDVDRNVLEARMSVTEERVQELNRRFLDFMGKSENVEAATKEIYEDLLDEVLMGFVFDVHRTTKTGSSDVEEGIPDDESYAIVGKRNRGEFLFIFAPRCLNCTFLLRSFRSFYQTIGKL